MAAALYPEQNQRVREAMALLLREAKGNHAALGRRIGKDPAWISKFMAGGAGAAMETATIVAREIGKPVAELLGITPRPMVTWAEIPNFEQALDLAIAASGDRYHARVWEIVGRLNIEPAPERIEPHDLINAAQLVDGLRAKKYTSGSDTSPPSNRGSGSKIRKPR